MKSKWKLTGFGYPNLHIALLNHMSGKTHKTYKSINWLNIKEFYNNMLLNSFIYRAGGCINRPCAFTSVNATNNYE